MFFDFDLLYIGGVVGFLVLLGHRESKASRQNKTDWERAAERLGLDYSVAAGSDLPALSGHLNGFAIQFDVHHVGLSYVPRLRVDGRGKIDPTINIISQESAWATLQSNKPLPEDVPVHDRAVDQRVYIHGPEARILALLSHEAREAVITFADQGRVAVVDALVELNLLERPTYEQIVSAVHSAIAVAKRLVLPLEATAQALAENALTDPNPQVRQRSRECLSAHLCSPSRHALYAALDGPAPLRSKAAARAALQDADPRLRLLGAMLVGGDEGYAALKQLAENEAQDAQTRAQALVTLTTRFRWAKVAPSVEAALRAKSDLLRMAAVTAVGEARDASLLDHVCALAAGANTDLALALVGVLAAFEAPEAERALIELLGHGFDEVCIPAAEALTRTGTVRAIEPLLRLAAEKRASRELKAAARAAVRAIQSRLGDAEAGRLSLAEAPEHEGALSLVGEAGGLALAEEESRKPG